MIISAALLFSGAFAFIRTLLRFNRTRSSLSDEWNALIQQITREVGLKHAPSVWCSSAITSPAVTGIWRPVLLLPADFGQAFTAREARFILLHELTHVKRHDLPLNALLCTLMALHWFNPLLWLAFYKVRIDREVACDAQVLENAPPQRRVEYGHALLKAESAFMPLQLSLGFVGLFHSGVALRSRIQSIIHSQPSHPVMKAITFASICLLTFFGITRAEQPGNNAPEVFIEVRPVEFAGRARELLTPFATTGELPSVAGMLNEDQMNSLWRSIELAEGATVFQMRRATVHSGQRAKFEIGGKFFYKGVDGKQAMKQLGTILDMLPKLKAEHEIEIEMSPQIVGLKGMEQMGSGMEQPVFSDFKTSMLVPMTSGQTVILGLPATSQTQKIEDRSPEGVMTKTIKVAKNMMVFVTVHLAGLASSTPVVAEPAAQKSSQPVAQKSPLKAKLDTIVIPEVQFKNASLSDAVAFLCRKSLDLDTITTDRNQKGVNIIVRGGANTVGSKLTLDLKNVQLGEALRYVAELSRMQLVVQQSAVLLISSANHEGHQNQPLSGEASRGVSETFVRSNGASSAYKILVGDSDGKIQTVQENMRHEQSLGKMPGAAQIILPQVQFQELNMESAIEFLRVKSRELDPAKQGLNIFVKPGANLQARITMQLKNIPVYEALRYTADLAGCRLVVDGEAMVIQPLK